MRLTKHEIGAIKTSLAEVFPGARIYLFGSRVDDKRRGGDIDLYILTKERDRLAWKRVDFLVRLKRRIGERRIDVVISRDPNRPIEREALTRGIEL